MAERASGELVEQIAGVGIGADITDQEAAALVDWYTKLAASVASFPQADLRRVEPPLRSVPGPRP